MIEIEVNGKKENVSENTYNYIKKLEAKTSKKFPYLIINHKNDLDLIDKILYIYSMATNKPLRGYERTVLKYYIKYGYTKETKGIIIEDTNKKDGDVRNADTQLRSNGYLKHGVLNQRKSSLSEDMEMLRQTFIMDKYKIYQLAFLKE